MRIFNVWSPDAGQKQKDGRLVKALDARDAACEWAQRSDAARLEYTIAKGEPATVLVMDGPDGEVTKWLVKGESMPTYSARALT